MKKALYILCALVVATGCNVLNNTAKREFDDGYYFQTVEGTREKVYVDVENETIRIHPTKLRGKEWVVDDREPHQLYHKKRDDAFDEAVAFIKPSFDIDFLTVPLKFRPGQESIPAQLNANLNASLYFGYRIDRYTLSYETDPLGESHRNINHFGFSLGPFIGFGNTLMSPVNTNHVLQEEYDGIVWSKGIAGIVAVNKVTLGIAFGFDNLLDENRKIWAYESKPWIGFAFGINLN